MNGGSGRIGANGKPEIRIKRKYTFRNRRRASKGRSAIVDQGRAGILEQTRSGNRRTNAGDPKSDSGVDRTRVESIAGGGAAETERIAAERTADASQTDAQTETQAQDFIAQEQQPGERRGRQSKAYKEQLKFEAAQKTAQAILDILNGIAGSSVSPDAIMQTGEREMIEPPLTRIISRLEPDIIEKFSAISDPFAVIVGFAMWGYRVSELAQRKVESETARTVGAEIPKEEQITTEPPAASETTVAPSNGDEQQKISRNAIRVVGESIETLI